MGAICASRADSYIKKDKGVISSAGSSGSTENLLIDNEEEAEVSAGANQEEIAAEKSESAPVRMVMINGKLYMDAGASDIEGRCGMMDGSIDSSVESDKYPEIDNQSNFGSGYGYQYVSESGIDVNIDGQWIRFETSYDGQEVPEQSSNSSASYAGDKNVEASGGEEEPYMGEQSTDKPNINEPETVEDTLPLETVLPVKFEISLNTDKVTSKGAEFIINNIGNETATTGLDFTVEKLKDGKWVECDVINENYAFSEIAKILQPGKNVFFADWSDLYGNLEKGSYRFLKTVYGNEDSQELCYEFTL